MSKWNIEDLGPRMANEFKETCNAFSGEARTYTEVTGVVGGEEHRWSYMQMFGAWRQDATAKWAEIGERYGWKATKDNRHEIAGAIAAAIAELKETRPVQDKRRTREEVEAADAARREQDAKRAAEDARLARLTKHSYDLPETAKAIKRVLGVLFPNTPFSVRSERYSGGYSINAYWTDGPTTIKDVLNVFQTKHFDGMTDSETSVGPSEWNGHLFRFTGGYVFGNRSLSRATYEKAAARFAAETGLPAPAIIGTDKNPHVDHADSAPCGFKLFTHDTEHPEGILCRDECSHESAARVVEQIAHHMDLEAPAVELGAEYEDVRATVYRILIGEIGGAPEGAAAESVAGVTGVTARLNPSKEGVEIRFPAKPDAAVLARLKASGWRWSKFSKCWYARDTARARQLAEEIAEAKLGDPEGAGHAPDVDRIYEDQCAAACGLL